MPGFGGSGPLRGGNRWMVASHVLFYGTLLLGTVSALPSAATPAVTATLVLLAGWYWYWMVLHPDRLLARPAVALYFLVSAALWWVLLAVDRSYGVLSITALVQLFGFLTWRAALAAAGLVGVIVLAGQGVSGSVIGGGGLAWRGVGWGEVADVALSVTLMTLCFAYVRTVLRQSEGRRRMLEELQATRDELAVAERRAGALQERQRLAGDIHDTLTQGLASIVMLLEAARAWPDPGSPTAAEHVDQALDSARQSLQEVRRLVWDLRPEALERGSLAETLHRLCAQLTDQTQVAAQTVVTGQVRRLPTEVEVTLLRAAQETLANVRRHGAARQVTVTLSYMDHQAVLDIRDDGMGFDPAALAESPSPRGGLGLVAMRERVEAMEGTLTVDSAPGQGTTVVVVLPVQPADRALTGSPAPAR
ncbi:MAG: sensor histidine kinase [Actinomycetota bacterium]|nr:sensor histidine kinase [Actinomycetota bacterium]